MEYYAKIKYIEKGLFRVSVTILKEDSESKINWIIDNKKFIRYNRAYKWAVRRIFTEVMKSSDTVFLRELDLIRKDYNGKH